MQVPTCWIEELPLNETLKLLTGLAHDHFLEGGPLGSQLDELLQSKRWDLLVNFKLDQSDPDWDVYHLIQCRQGLGFFQKLESIDIGIDKTAVALEKFHETERDCSVTNAYLRTPVSVMSKLPYVVRLIESARRKIRFVLGVCPKADKLRFHFGPGATTAIKKKAAAPEAKFASGFQCSTSMLASGLLPEYLRQVPHWLNAFVEDIVPKELDGQYSVVEVDLVPGKLVCVPKSAKTYRTILVEPSLNGFVQQGIRHAMETCLKRAGLATDDQSRNALLARRGSISDDLATLDLSSASDLISYELVKSLLPSDWFQLLCSARTGAAKVGDEVIPLEKFSSMGNAYTFPLETLVFWAITMAAGDLSGDSFPAQDVAVYGDDIIIPSRGYKHVAQALMFLGFKLNHDKSFFKGPFRESCGHDYYRGIDVRPFYQKKLVSGESLFALHNFYIRNLDYRRASIVQSAIPESLRIFGPDGYGDGHLLSESFPQRRKSSWLEKGYMGYAFDTFTLGPVKKVTRYPGDYVTPLYSIYTKGRVPIHESISGLDESTPVCFGKDGRPIWTYPGSNGYKRTSIYTLSSV